MDPERIKALVFRAAYGLLGLYLVVRVLTTLAGGPPAQVATVEFTAAKFDTTLLAWEPTDYDRNLIKDPFVPYPIFREAAPPPIVATSDADTVFMVEQFQEALVLPPTGLVVYGIIQGRGRNSALINGGTYYLGDEIEGYEIVDITPDKVMLERGGVQFSLRIGGS
jgi:hypothetical protein